MDENLTVLKPFGPSIAKFNLPQKIIDNINSHVDKVIKNKDKIKKLDYGSNLAGQVKQEFILEKEIIDKGLGSFLFKAIKKYIYQASNQNIKEVIYKSLWIVRQFENEYNPLHMHTGHISGVCYLKIPKSFGEKSQMNKKKNPNGCIVLTHGSEQFLCPSIKTITPKIGEFYLFPHYMLHSVYPFKGTGERRSLSFNAFLK